MSRKKRKFEQMLGGFNAGVSGKSTDFPAQRNFDAAFGCLDNNFQQDDHDANRFLEVPDIITPSNHNQNRLQGFAGGILSGAFMKTHLTPLQHKLDTPNSITRANMVADNQIDTSDHQNQMPGSTVDQAHHLLLQAHLDQQHAFNSPIDQAIYFYSSLPQQTLVYAPQNMDAGGQQGTPLHQ